LKSVLIDDLVECTRYSIILKALDSERSKLPSGSWVKIRLVAKLTSHQNHSLGTAYQSLFLLSSWQGYDQDLSMPFRADSVLHVEVKEWIVTCCPSFPSVLTCRPVSQGHPEFLLPEEKHKVVSILTP
jgi:hypothetical protein